MSRNTARPLSPHLTRYRWGPNMTASAVHRNAGIVLATVGFALLTAWLVALAMGEDSYAKFMTVARHPLALIVPIGLSWALFQHMASGVRHLVLDTGAGYELKGNRASALATFAVSTVATAVFWLLILTRGA